MSVFHANNGGVKGNLSKINLVVLSEIKVEDSIK